MTTHNLLFTSAGRRVELIQIFKNKNFNTHAADCDPTAPTLFHAHQKHLVPKITQQPEHYLATLMEICTQNNIHALIPLIDPELPLLARAKETFLNLDTRLLISAPENTDIAFDKYKTYQFFKKINLPTPETILLEDALKNPETNPPNLFPALLKPRFGSAGKGIFPCDDIQHAQYLHDRGELKDYVLQQKVTGQEITTDLFGDGTGKLAAAVQRKRLKIRGGEVERGITVKYPTLFTMAETFGQTFKPYGAVNIQCFYHKEKDQAYYIEINPRFGGGYPLAFHAGADFPGMVTQLIEGKPLPETIGDYREGLLMSRYDSAVYTQYPE